MALTLAFGDARAGWYGWARHGERSALAALFRGRELVGVGGDGLRISEASASWEGVELAFEPTSAPVGPGGGEQLVRVTGTVHGDAVDCAGQLSHGRADWASLELVRSVGAWLGTDGIVLESLRPAGADGHDSERVWAAVVEGGEPAAVAEPRLSTTYDGDGHQRRAGLELWMTEEEGYPIRAAGEVICGTSLDLDGLRLDLAFLRWHCQGHEGVGRYDIARKSP